MADIYRNFANQYLLIITPKDEALMTGSSIKTLSLDFVL
jgi:hypothetical protein